MSIVFSHFRRRTTFALNVVTVSLVALISGSAAIADEWQLTLNALATKVSSGGGAPLELKLANLGDTAGTVPHVWDEPFWGPWKWRWEGDGGQTIKMTAEHVSFGVIPTPRPSRKVRISPGSDASWTVVVPVPRSLASKKHINLSVSVPVRAGEEATECMASCRFVLVPSADPPTIPGVRKDVPQVAMATGMESLAYASVQNARATDAVRRAGFDGDDLLLLASFCMTLSKNQFDLEAWQAIEELPDDNRAIRDVNLQRALIRGKIRLVREQMELIRVSVTGKYSFSEDLIKAAEACVK
jgi:hypothetical protein